MCRQMNGSFLEDEIEEKQLPKQNLLNKDYVHTNYYLIKFT